MIYVFFWLVGMDDGSKHVMFCLFCYHHHHHHHHHHNPNGLTSFWLNAPTGHGDGLCNWSQVEFEDTMEQGYPAGERAIEGFLIHFDYGALAPARIIPSISG